MTWEDALPVEHTLTDIEVRVLGALIEKEITTPDYYPLSLNSLVTACNQSSNRNPVTHYDEGEVMDAADTLRAKGLVHLVDRGQSRVNKYRHVVYEALNFGRPAIAVMCVLMLRGHQTIGEIRTRSASLYDFASLEQTQTTLDSLMAGEKPFVVRLQRQPGQKEVRYAHLLSGEVQAAVEPEPQQHPQPEPNLDRLERLEKDVEDLKRQFEQFRRQFQ
jgi:uncharacterized protein YceH (UPF0502 family)